MTSVNFSTPKKQNPNPHPYAIKTTSTALLSRNSSSSSTPSTTHHYIPPSSPSPSPTQTGFDLKGEKRYTRHRYSRSLTSDLPRPLPATPFPTTGFGDSNTAVDDDDDTPRRKIQRAYSLPQGIELPEDPKRWTPSEVSMYLTSTLGGHDLPTAIARDIATFVRDKKITGKSFLRLNEIDLEEYDIHQLWKTTLVNASRELRKNVLNGRIYDNHDDLSSNANFVITNRQRSLSTTSETRGRVRDMIDTLERSSSASSSEDGNRDKDHRRHRSSEQQQQQGRLPQRGSVNNLFGTSGPGPDTDVEDKDSTITAHAKRNVNGNEPRLLPFPPTGPSNSNGYAHILTPSHTGTSYSLPSSPETTPYYLDLNHQLLQQQPPYLFSQNAFDYYELGFKNSLPTSTSPTPLMAPPIGPPIRSPNSQRYIVQHNHVNINNVQSSTTGDGDSTGNKRLLPYPPIVGEAELFHPRPRMGLGVGGLAGGLENGLENGDEDGKGEGDENALETHTQNVDSDFASPEGRSTASSETSGSGIGTKNEIGLATVRTQDRPKDEEEPSIQDLLLAQPQAHAAISGAEAWEMELGETVKRIINNSNAVVPGEGVGGSKIRTRPRKREVMMGEIGRKSGKAGAIGGLEGGKKRVLDPALFQAPDQVANGGELKTDSTVLEPESSSVSASASLSTSTTLDERESLIAERESVVAARESSLNIRESSIVERESTITADKSQVQKRELDVAEREFDVKKREQEVYEREIRVERREEEVKEWYEGKLVEIERVLAVPPHNSHPTPASANVKSRWPASSIEFARRLCATFLLPVLGEERTPGFLLRANGVDESASASTTATSMPLTSSSSGPPTPPLISSWTLKRDFFLNRVLGGTTARGTGSYLVLMSIGICVVFLRGFVRRAGRR